MHLTYACMWMYTVSEHVYTHENTHSFIGVTATVKAHVDVLVHVIPALCGES